MDIDDENTAPFPLWTEEEKQILIDNYPSCTTSELCYMFPIRSIESIRTEAYKLGLKKTPETRRRGIQNSFGRGGKQSRVALRGWERDILASFADSLPLPELQVLLPSRSTDEIREFADLMGITIRD